jgi:hypothetical protein
VRLAIRAGISELRFAVLFSIRAVIGAPRFALARGVGDHLIKQLIGHRSASLAIRVRLAFALRPSLAPHQVPLALIGPEGPTV